jgi:hypothetical protein
MMKAVYRREKKRIAAEDGGGVGTVGNWIMGTTIQLDKKNEFQCSSARWDDYGLQPFIIYFTKN